MAILWADGFELNAALLGRSLVAVMLAAFVGFFMRLCQMRMRFRRDMKQYDIPILPHSFLLGHLVHIGKALAGFPPDFSKIAMPYTINKMYPEICSHGIVYFDTWPFGWHTCMVFHPDIVSQFTQEHSLLKHEMVARELGPLTSALDLTSIEGQQWKFWRSVFNPSFSSKNITALLPAFLEEIQVLKERFIRAADTGEVVNMEKTVQAATVDVICRAVLGIRLNSQSGNTDFFQTLQNQIWWLCCDYTIGAILKENFPLRKYFIWKNDLKMRQFLTPIIEKGIKEFDDVSVGEAKTVNYLAIKGHRAEVQQQSANGATKASSKLVNEEFLEFAMANLKIFIFAGHDTTASTVSFAYSRLYQDQAILAKIRAEHDDVLGSDPTQALGRLTEDPSLLNRMPYTNAVLKEVLRLYPPASTARQGSPSFLLTHPDTGKRYPTDGYMTWSASWLTHRYPGYWERAEEFLPERWLAKEGDPLYPRKNAWRPFEQGARNCIGQELAQVEMRAILAMTLRELEFEPVYAEDAPEAIGEKAYQSMGVGDITGHVKDGFPVRVKVRARGSKA